MVHRVFNLQLFWLACSPNRHSVRIIAYVLLCGYTPFRSDDLKVLIKETAAAQVEFQDRYWKNVSSEGSIFNID
jgi:calcium/calmodulin-dependent protein kinase I